MTDYTPSSSITLTPKRRRTGLVVWLVAAGIIVLAVAGVGAYVLLGRSMTVSGVMVLTDLSSGVQVDSTDGVTCTGKGSYLDIQAGAEVTVTDAAGATVALGTLEAGHYDTAKGCVFSWKVSVPAGKKFYGIEVGHRGVLRYSEAELRNPLTMSLN